jgi:hypothetical protein
MRPDRAARRRNSSRCAQRGVAVPHDLRRTPLHVGLLLPVGAQRFLRAYPTGGDLANFLFFPARPFVVTCSAEVVQEPLRTRADPFDGN